MVYLDASAIVKLVVPEPESAALRGELTRDAEWVSSALARVEVLRALRRTGATVDSFRFAEELLDRMALVAVDQPILNAAASAEPAGLRSLDALHLATVLSLVGVDAFVGYDGRLNAAVAAAGLPVLSPR